jgi:hypothetical protein
MWWGISLALLFLIASIIGFDLDTRGTLHESAVSSAATDETVR